MQKYKDAFAKWRQEYLLRALLVCDNNVSEAAKLTGLNRTHFYHLINRAQINRDKVGAGRKEQNKGNKAWQELSRAGAQS